MTALASAATISPCGKYRTWLNPSTADAQHDDPTIRRCLGFMRRERLIGLAVVNLFTGRATKPRDLWTIDDPVGPDADDAIERALGMVENPTLLAEHFPDSAPGHIVCAWGGIPAGSPDWFATMRHDRIERVLDRAARRCRPLWALGVTDGGAPRHPLYVRGDAPLIPFTRQPLDRKGRPL